MFPLTMTVLGLETHMPQGDPTCEIRHVQYYMYNTTCTILHVQYYMYNTTCTILHVEYYKHAQKREREREREREMEGGREGEREGGRERHYYMLNTTNMFNTTCTNLHAQYYVYNNICTIIYVQ